MEVADQWRREWAGTAEYGKVVEGGVTRRIARAMEVLHASAPGARVKVMRAAYHTTAGPGVPASSYMVHASRRVYSSGFNSGFLEPPSVPTEPLEISSTPLALLQDSQADTENYKVTEPDDFEISEPSKWRSSTGGSIRMPSEESSSTDNASIIDVSKNHKSEFRKYSCDSENSDIPLSGRSSRLSPLLDTPALSTLKFKSLLNGNSDWNNRRKSYSFEDTSPLSETVLHSNETLAMESSTDSGICKSTELVNDQADETHHRYFGCNESSDYARDNTFENWLSKNKQNNNYKKGTKFKGYNDHETVNEKPKDNIILQPTGKVSITLPVTLETQQEYESRKQYEEHQRKIKRVEFCKTELHFAAETGKVNIIATDEKPPPSTDFRKRRSAFVPMRDMPEKPIMLFGEKINDFSNESNSLSYTISELNESDENTAATKSILKNKIPKPKPYLLGENMAFGAHNEPKNDDANNTSYVSTAVSLINKQLQAEKISDSETSTSFSRQQTVSTKTNAFRTTNQGPPENVTSKRDSYDFSVGKTQKVVRIHEETNKFNSAKRTPAIKRSPTPARLKTRELRESDLTYFGVDNSSKNVGEPKQAHIKSRENQDYSLDDLLQSVKLIQQVSNSVCNSESEEAPEYQNIPINSNYVPKPTPRIRSKHDDKPNYIEEIVLKPIIEQDTVSQDDIISYRRSKSRKQEETSSMKNRSRSEPRKSHKFNSNEKTQRQPDQSRISREHSSTEHEHLVPAKAQTYRTRAGNSPIYVNLKIEQTRKGTIPKSDDKPRYNNNQRVPRSNDSSMGKMHRKLDATKPNSSQDTDGKILLKNGQMQDDKTKVTLEGTNQNHKQNTAMRQSEKCDKSLLSKPNLQMKLSNENSIDTSTTNKSSESNSFNRTSSIADKKEHKSRSLHRHLKAAPDELTLNRVTTSQSTKESTDNTSRSEVKDHKRQSSKDKSSTRNDITTIVPKVGKNSSANKSYQDSTRHGSRSSRREYVINYDDKNGTVSSVCKIRSGSGSPRRKKTSKEVVKEKYKEHLKHKSSDKAALPQIDHQRNSNTMNENRKLKKLHNPRSCQVL